jgi:hypothetical protein
MSASQESDKDQSITIDTAMKVTDMTSVRAPKERLSGCQTFMQP